MSRIPASPQNMNAPVALPFMAKATVPPRSAEQAPAAQSPPQSPTTNTSDQVALEKHGGSMSHYNLGLDAPSSTDPVTKEEVQWALKLEDKVVKGYQPNAQEFEKYTDISARLADCNPARQMDDSDEIEVKKPQKVESGAVSDAELKWALRLEDRVKQGYQPTTEEVTAYEKIYTQMAPQENVDSKIPKKDLSWAQRLMEKVGQGYQASPEEVKRYDSIYTKAQEAIQAKHQGPEDKAIQWAKNLQTKVTQGYQPDASEIKRYTEIYERLQQGVK